MAKQATKENHSATRLSHGDFAFGKENYVIMIVGILVIIIGFMLMAGGASTDPAVFNEEIFSTRRITIAPIVVMLGFMIEVYAIVKRSKE